eukprot:10201898-Prorocentrum_lima.AAC.1
MTSSLVGSEMCIRDSNPGMGHGEVAGFEASVVLNRKDFGVDIDMPLAVSYTHLTLPTICSV